MTANWAIIAAFCSIALFSYLGMLFLTQRGWIVSGWSVLALFGFPSVSLVVSIAFSAWPETATVYGVMLICVGWLGSYLVSPIFGLLIGILGVAFSGRLEKWIVVGTCIAAVLMMAGPNEYYDHRPQIYPELAGILFLTAAWNLAAVQKPINFITENPSPRSELNSEYEGSYERKMGSNQKVDVPLVLTSIETRFNELERELAELRKELGK